MKPKHSQFLCLCLLPLLQCLPSFAQGTAFIYQGQLLSGGAPANGLYDLRLILYDAATNGNTIAGPITNSAVAVSNGLFTTQIDFGSVFTGAALWLHLGVRSNGVGAFSAVSPRQPLAPAPYAIFANTSSNLSGTVSSAGLSGTYGGALLLTNGGNILSGDGSGLTGLNANQLTSGKVPFSALGNAWKINGNAGLNPATGHFIGTTDNNPFEIDVNGLRAVRLEPAPNDTAQISNAVNVIQGSPANVLSGNVHGATIAGGGAVVYFGASGGNTIADNYDTIGGGVNNNIQSNAWESTIAGGNANLIQVSAYRSTIAGGFANQISSNAYQSVIGGGFNNIIGTNAFNATIAGGVINQIAAYNYAPTIAGGYNNSIGTNANDSTISGGIQNSILTGSSYATIAGGGGNQIQTNSYGAAIGGGIYNVINANSSYGVISGGYLNLVGTNAYMATIGGGLQNCIVDNADRAFIGSGTANSNFFAGAFMGAGYYNLASNFDVAIVAGAFNMNAGYRAFIGAGQGNIISNSADYAVIPGGYNNQVVGAYSMAAGQQAQALNPGTFVWADSQAGAFASTSSNQFLVRARGGVGIGTTAPGAQLDVAGPSGTAIRVTGPSGGGSTVACELTPFAPGTNGPSAKLMATDDGVYSAHLDLMTKVPGGPANALQSRLRITSGGNVGIATTSPAHLLQVGANASPAYCDGTTWVNGSDRNSKSGFHLVDPADALAKVAALPVSYWYYTNDPATPHIGPMAQDFYDAFGVGPDNKHIATVDEGGVALAAIQGLNEKLEALTSELKIRDAELARLTKENQTLAERLDNLELTQGAWVQPSR